MVGGRRWPRSIVYSCVHICRLNRIKLRYLLKTNVIKSSWTNNLEKKLKIPVRTDHGEIILYSIYYIVFNILNFVAPTYLPTSCLRWLASGQTRRSRVEPFAGAHPAKGHRIRPFHQDDHWWPSQTAQVGYWLTPTWTYQLNQQELWFSPKQNLASFWAERLMILNALIVGNNRIKTQKIVLTIYRTKKCETVELNF